MTFTEKHYEHTFNLVLVFHCIKNLAHIPFPIHGFFFPFRYFDYVLVWPTEVEKVIEV